VSKREYSVLKEMIKDDECGWSYSRPTTLYYRWGYHEI
jgi:hypothetical protein